VRVAAGYVGRFTCLLTDVVMGGKRRRAGAAAEFPAVEMKVLYMTAFTLAKEEQFSDARGVRLTSRSSQTVTGGATEKVREVPPQATSPFDRRPILEHVSVPTRYPILSLERNGRGG